MEKIISPFTQEEVEAYHVDMGKIFKWLKMAIDTRKQDILRRKAIHKHKRQLKTQREEQKAAREAAREQFLLEKENEFNEANKEDVEAFKTWKDQARFYQYSCGSYSSSEEEN